MNRFESVTAGTASHSTWLPNDGNQVAGYKPLRWLMALLLVAFVAGCGNGGGGRDPILGGSASVLQGLVSIKVTPPTASIPVSGTQKYTATGTYNDGSSKDVTASSIWTSSTAGATVGPNTGLATGVTANVVPVVITAAFGGKTATANLTVNAATSVSFVVKPTTASIPVSGTQQFNAIQTFSDGTTQDRTTTSAAGTASWSTSGLSAANASVGAATGLALGVTVTPLGQPVVINAAFTPLVGPVLIATPATLAVTNATVVSIQVTPALASIAKGTNQNYQATAILSDGTTNNVTANPLTTWTATDVGAPLISPVASVGLHTGVAAGLNLGQSDIRAAFGGKTSPAGGAILTVTAAAPGPGPAGLVDLGTASTYGIMATTAMTLSNPATSHIYGDVGLLTTDAFTGFSFDVAPPTLISPISIFVTGQTTSLTYNSNNHGAMVTAFNDLNAAWVNNSPTIKPAPATPPTGALPAGGTFTAANQDLTGMLLGPGIYASSIPTDTLALSNGKGPLVLDAGGNANAVFIFQASDITTTSGGSVILRNGAQSKNVYWVLAKTATIGLGSVFQGTILAGNVVTLDLGASVEGRVLAGAGLAVPADGALTINGGVVTVP